MKTNPQYRFSRGNSGYVTFDSKGCVLEAKGFAQLMWSSLNIDKDLIGKHVDDLAELLKKNGVSRNVYFDFETQVHVPLLKEMLQNRR